MFFNSSGKIQIHKVLFFRIFGGLKFLILERRSRILNHANANYSFLGGYQADREE